MDMDEYCDARLLLNTSTGRFLRTDTNLMAHLLCDHRVIDVASGGFLVLAHKTTPRAGMRVLNPLTGRSIRFKAPLPTYPSVTADVLGSPPTLVLCDPCIQQTIQG